MKLLLLIGLLSSSHTLAPPPINFTREVVVVDGQRYIASFNGRTLRFDRAHGIFRVPEKKKGNDIWNPFEGLCGCAGCLLYVLGGGGFWIGLLWAIFTWWGW